MYPWVWFWAPEFRYPWSGAVSQDIEPSAVFSTLVPPGAGDAQIERRATEVASYGTQLGLITDVLIDLAERSQVRGDDAKKALRDLQKVRDAIQRVKDAEYSIQRVMDEVALRQEAERDGRERRSVGNISR